MTTPDDLAARFQQKVQDALFQDAVRELMGIMTRWLESEPLQELLPPEQMRRWIHEECQPEVIDKRLAEPFERAWNRGVERVRKDERTLGEVLGEELSEELNKAADRLEPSEEAVRALLEQGAFEEMMAQVLYDGIMGFLKRVDLLGPIIDKLPVLGAIRRRIMKTFKDEFERRAELQVRSFLEGAAKAAQQQAIRYILSDANRSKFKQVRRKLAERLLNTAVRRLAPAGERSEKLRKEAWNTVRSILQREETWRQEYDELAERYGERNLKSLREEWALPDLNERLQPLLVRWFLAGLEDPGIQAWYRQNPLPPEDPAANP